MAWLNICFLLESQLCRCFGQIVDNTRLVAHRSLSSFTFLLCEVVDSEKMLTHHFILVVFLVIFLRGVHSTIWIKNVRSQGPAAAIAGTKCLATLTKYYFYDPTITRTKTIVISHSRYVSSPVREIQLQYLEWLHHTIATGDMEGCVQWNWFTHFQLKLIGMFLALACSSSWFRTIIRSNTSSPFKRMPFMKPISTCWLWTISRE